MGRTQGPSRYGLGNYSGGDWKGHADGSPEASPFWGLRQRSAKADLSGDARMKGVGGGRHPSGRALRGEAWHEVPREGDFNRPE